MSGSTLKLYRHILKAAKSFPSKNRNGLIEEIKTEFRENAGATDAGDVQKKIALARELLGAALSIEAALAAASP